MTQIGVHCIAELYECPPSLLNDRQHIIQAIREAAKRAKSELLNEVCHQFEPHGVTALALLAESHISIHTWPEQGYAAVDAFTCGNAIPEAACRYLARALKSKRPVFSRTLRGVQRHQLTTFDMKPRIEPAPVRAADPIPTEADDACQELSLAQISG